MSKEPLEISGYTILAVQFPEVSSFTVAATHYLYLHPHEPRTPDVDSPRSLFLVNLPIDTTETHIRHLFSVQLSAGRVERVEFQNESTKKYTALHPVQRNPGSKKRKRITTDDLLAELDNITLPSTWDRQLQRSGAHAVVMFVDKLSMETSMKAARRASKNGTKIVWGEGIEDRLPPLGIRRYEAHNLLRYPPRDELLRTANDYMTVFMQVEKAREEEAARKAQQPDEDGFVTVTRGPKNNSVVREEEVKQLIEKQRQRDAGFGDFYRFQTREKRKERQNELLKQFGEDKKKLEEMKKRRGKLRVKYSLFSYPFLTSSFPKDPSTAGDRLTIHSPSERIA
jgi:ribosomal RNA-processing protein 7